VSSHTALSSPISLHQLSCATTATLCTTQRLTHHYFIRALCCNLHTITLLHCIYNLHTTTTALHISLHCALCNNLHTITTASHMQLAHCNYCTAHITTLCTMQQLAHYHYCISYATCTLQLLHVTYHYIVHYSKT
jgi:hypothetical protein